MPLGRVLRHNLHLNTCGIRSITFGMFVDFFWMPTIRTVDADMLIPCRSAFDLSTPNHQR
jgi:hypothetical protein